ncbi:MAG: metal-dependent hydrolase [Acidobacteria bacterium]|nr:metal-dependent hydrolase [Acidobacteriota bacterium]
MAPSRLAITWLGHGTFLLRSPAGKRLLIDPWLNGNPSCPAVFREPDRLRPLDLILVTHGHSDHTGDLVQVARATGAPVVAIFEICKWLEQKGLTNLMPMNKGGTERVADIAVTMVDARHSSSMIEGSTFVYLGEPAGYVLRFEDGVTAYFAGDTSLFGDMRLIAELHHPDLAFLPIGDRFTMGPESAAKACELLQVKQVVPMHYGTFPVLTGTPARLRELVEPRGVEVLELRPGETTE